MLKFIILLGICSAFVSGHKLPEPDKPCDKIVGCYYAGGTKEAIYGSLCTHMFYSYVGIGKDATVKIIDPYADIEENGFKRFNDLRKKSPNLKTLVSMANRGNELMATTDADSPYRVLTDPNLRENLVNNIVNFVKKYGFSGIDLDLSDPPQSGGHPSDKENLVLSLKALREKFDKEGLILSALVDPNEATAQRFYDINGISTYVNFINLRTFDFHGNSDADRKLGVTHTSPMYPSSKENAEDRKKNIDYVVKYWIAELAPPSKLILGTSSYGKSYTLANPKQVGRGAPLSVEGSYTSSPRDTKEYLLQEYYNICPLLKYPEWNRLYDKEQQVPYIYSGNEIIAYDDVDSIKTKAVYAKNMKLGGAMLWSVGEDDFSGVCGEKFPLLKTLNQVLRNKC